MNVNIELFDVGCVVKWIVKIDKVTFEVAKC